VGTSVGEVERLANRYDLQHEVAAGKGRTLWHGHDVVLDRSVGVLILDRDHPHAEQVRLAAQAAARVEHPCVLRVVDADVADGQVIVVTRWLAGTTLAQLLDQGPLDPGQALTIARDVADGLTAAAAEGVHHLVLDPRDVLVTDHGVVVVGVGVRAALEGVTPDDDAESVDAWRVGALLYAALTQRWPGHTCAGLPAAPTVAGRVARPRQVRAGVPVELDDIVWRTLQPDAADPLDTPEQVANALRAVEEPSTPPVPRHDATDAPSHWPAVVITVVVTLFVLAGLLMGWQIWRDTARDDPAPTTTPTRAESPTASSPPEIDVALPLVSAAAFDPAGDGEENDADADAAIDGDQQTSWQTLTYASRDLGQLKPGVGLQVTLAGVQPVGGIELTLVGRGTDLEIWADKGTPQDPTAARPLAGLTRLASVRGAGDELTLRFAPPVETETVLIWLTALPSDGDGYRGGVAEVTLVS
jgi:hypothetical protein